ncbi:lipid A biosynthesis acyltransferase [Xylanibacillus composti]|uniref:Lipid A biosynthesis acyltransferase n=1 Tax=Xylanibacillus composti TaxID=1572762 RepID=A0A8J4H0W5_9BACL|nr:lipid A biosynthesis acyltransferase [Xylanibacillus composti]MDT9725776.1 lipid A biosynthesis acyltransferase [Xylanibacillus composti]GIQ67510.1 hypothetical protein XYCOK13_03340 [Xylanibacillus composti]
MYDWIGNMVSEEARLQSWARWSRRLPRRWLEKLIRSAAWLLVCIWGRGIRRAVLNNMSELLPDRTDRERRRYARQYFQHAGMTLYEILIDAERLTEGEGRRFELHGERHLEEALRLGRGAIVYAPHMGNFFYAYWLLSRKYPCITVGTASDPALAPLYRRFEAMGCQGLDYDRTPPLKLYRALSRHVQAGGVVFLLGDFYRPTFPHVPFFGRLSRLPQGAAALALDGNVPIVPMYACRLGEFRHQIRFEPGIVNWGSGKDARRQASVELSGRLEQMIRERPDQWFYWFNAHERWEL